MTPLTIREESPNDAAAIRRIHSAAFPSLAEADLVDALRQHRALVLSLVAEVEGDLVGDRKSVV
jgi:putative acetyltransferase